MAEAVHLIPVGIDFERLFLPITRGGLDADRVRLFRSAPTQAGGAEADLARTMVDRLEYTFGTVQGVPVETREIPDVYDYRDVYELAYEQVRDVVDGGDAAWINISSMPRTVAFAFATAAHVLVVERPDVRERVHTYYVSPEEYLVTTMLAELETQADFLDRVASESDDDALAESARERRDALASLLSDVTESGLTRGAKTMDGDRYVEFPMAPLADLREFERTVLAFLHVEGAMASTSALARELAAAVGTESDESFRSKVQYNVTQLEEKGYVDRHEEDNRYVTRLSLMGELWAATHDHAVDGEG